MQPGAAKGELSRVTKPGIRCCQSGAERDSKMAGLDGRFRWPVLLC